MESYKLLINQQAEHFRRNWEERNDLVMYAFCFSCINSNAGTETTVLKGTVGFSQVDIRFLAELP